jgi:3-hydroxyacyl-CoA dehydrogenase
MSNVGKYVINGSIGIVRIDSPPVNALGVTVRRALQEGFSGFAADGEVKAIVLICGGRTFFAGADISEFGKPRQEPALPTVLDAIDGLSKPVVAAIHGTALGGGYELALVCHYRIAVPSAKVGLPEVHLGLLPGAGGTQRLPRIVGAAAALDIIVGGGAIPAAKALSLGMIDAIAEEGQLEEDAMAFAKRILAEDRPMQRVRDRQDKVDPDKGNTRLFADFREKNAREMRGFKAPEHIIRTIEAAVELPFDQGLERERELFLELRNSTESAAQRYFFFAERETSKIPSIDSSTETVPIKSVGLIGAGTMGAGIATNFLNAGIPVTLLDVSQEALERGRTAIRRNYENAVKEGRLSAELAVQRLNLITPALALDALMNVDLVIEAVFEQMSIKKEVFGKLDTIAKEGAIFASVTSLPDLDELAAATSRPAGVIGLHFFSPANLVRLLEVVRGEKTSKEVIATAMKLAKTIGKVPVLCRACNGFIANRVMAGRGSQAEALILEGPTPSQVDQALHDYGFTMGPFEMMDLLGLDVVGREDAGPSVRGDLVKLNRLGKKRNGGYYDYDEHGRATPSPIAANIIADFARSKAGRNMGAQSADDIVARLLYPVVNEGARVLEDGIAVRASDIDTACILGYSWPVYTGGPMFWADTVGLPKIVAKLKQLEAEHGGKFKPSKLLMEKAASGGSFVRV